MVSRRWWFKNVAEWMRWRESRSGMMGLKPRGADKTAMKM